MGCGGSRTKLEGVDLPLDHWMEPTGVEECDKGFKEAGELMVSLEIVRSKVVDDFDELVVCTGASAYKNPDLEKCILSFFYSAEVEHAEFMKGIESSSDAPFFTHKAKLSAKAQKTHDHLVKFMNGLRECEKHWDEAKNDNLKDIASALGKTDFDKVFPEKLKDKKPGEMYVTF
jgi:hypothetical protein